MPIFLCLGSANGELTPHASSLEALMSEHSITAFGRTPTTLCGLVQLGNALNCALALQTVARRGAPEFGIALHAGSHERLGRLILGPGPNRSHHLAKAAWSGQILLSAEYLDAVKLPPEATAKPLGAHMLTDLAPPQPIYQLNHPLCTPENFRPLRSLSYYPNNLPTQPAGFVGRIRELNDLDTLLHNPSVRLITLTGPGGIGKTRLAIQAAAEVARDFPHGVYFVSCEALSSGTLLPSTIGKALKLPSSGRVDPGIHLLNQLRRRTLLLILDNYESMLPDTTLLERFLEDAPNVKLMVTSREPLDVAGEHIYSLGGLSYPHRKSPNEVSRFETYDAVQLFFLAALRTDKLFAIPESTRDAVITTCELSEGLPLGLEVAATWVSVFSCQEIAEKITQGLGLLETTRRDLPARHRSLRAVFEFAWKSLSLTDREKFVMCAVFRGSFTGDAARVVANANLEALERLARKSMLMQVGPQRYMMHPLLHHFATEQMASTEGLMEALEELHSKHFLGYLQEHSAALWDIRQRDTAEALVENLDDIRSAWLWACRAGHFALLREVIPGLLRLYTVREMSGDGATLFDESATLLRARLANMLLADRVCELALADCLVAEGLLTAALAQSNRAQDRLEKAQEIYLKLEAEQEMVNVYIGLGMVAHNRGQHHLARANFRWAYDRATTTHSARCERDASHFLGRISLTLGDKEAAGEYLDHSLVLSETLNDWWLGMHTLRLRGNVLKDIGDIEAAREYYHRSLELAQGYGSLPAIALALNNLGVLAIIASDYPLARRHYEQVVAIQRDTDNTRMLGNALHSLSVIVTDLGEPESGLELLDEAWEIHQQNADQDGKGFTLLYRAYASEVLQDHATVETTYRKAMTLFDASGNLGSACDARECLGFYLHSQGRYKEAEQLLQDALQARQVLNDPGGIATAHRGLGAVATSCGRFDEARDHFRQALELALRIQCA